MSYEKLKHHVGHKLTVANYGDGMELSVECEDCHEVLYTESKPSLEVVVDGYEELDGELSQIDFTINIMKGEELDRFYSGCVKYLTNKTMALIDNPDDEDFNEGSINGMEELGEKLLSLNADLKLEISGLDLEDEFKSKLANLENQLETE